MPIRRPQNRNPITTHSARLVTLLEMDAQKAYPCFPLAVSKQFPAPTGLAGTNYLRAVELLHLGTRCHVLTAGKGIAEVYALASGFGEGDKRSPADFAHTYEVRAQLFGRMKKGKAAAKEHAEDDRKADSYQKRTGKVAAKEQAGRDRMTHVNAKRSAANAKAAAEEQAEGDRKRKHYQDKKTADKAAAEAADEKSRARAAKEAQRRARGARRVSHARARGVIWEGKPLPASATF